MQVISAPLSRLNEAVWSPLPRLGVYSPHPKPHTASGSHSLTTRGKSMLEQTRLGPHAQMQRRTMSYPPTIYDADGRALPVLLEWSEWQPEVDPSPNLVDVLITLAVVAWFVAAWFWAT